MIDESLPELGTNFIIPKHYEDEADEVKEKMMPIFVREVNELSGYGYRDNYEYKIFIQRNKIRKEIEKISQKGKNSTLSVEEQETLKELRKQFIKTK